MTIHVKLSKSMGIKEGSKVFSGFMNFQQTVNGKFWMGLWWASYIGYIGDYFFLISTHFVDFSIMFFSGLHNK